MIFLASFTFAHKWWFLAIPLALLLLLVSGRKGMRNAITFSSLGILASIAKKPKTLPGGLHVSFLLIAILFGIIALARPQTKKTFDNESVEGIDMVITLDLSYSMIIEDFYPEDDRSRGSIQRLEAAKGVIKTFIDSRPNDRLGIIAFSGRPYSLSPITFEHSVLHDRLEAIEIGDIKEQGTAIGSAISASATRLTDKDAKSRVIILITDGASNSGKIEPIEAAKLASELDIKIYTIAIGTEHGRVPSSIQSFPKQEFDIPTLKSIASITKGEFYRARSISDLNNTFDTINRLEKTEVDTTVRTITTEHFHWFALIAALFMVFSLIHRTFNPESSL